jgi:hypothetical protein
VTLVGDVNSGLLVVAVFRAQDAGHPDGLAVKIQRSTDPAHLVGIIPLARETSDNV